MTCLWPRSINLKLQTPLCEQNKSILSPTKGCIDLVKRKEGFMVASSFFNLSFFGKQCSWHCVHLSPCRTFVSVTQFQPDLASVKDLKDTEVWQVLRKQEVKFGSKSKDARRCLVAPATTSPKFLETLELHLYLSLLLFPVILGNARQENVASWGPKIPFGNPGSKLLFPGLSHPFWF